LYMSVPPLVENYAKKNRSRNWLQLFDQHDLQLLNDCKFVFIFLLLSKLIFRNLGSYNILLERP
jgi:hypothetical protein